MQNSVKNADLRSNNKNLLSLLIYGCAMLAGMIFVFWISEMAFWNSSIDLNEQYLSIRSDEIAENIRTSLKYGKDLSNFYGIENELSKITDINKSGIGVCVTDNSGNVVSGIFPDDEDTARKMLGAVYTGLEKDPGEGNISLDKYDGLLYEMSGPAGEHAGALVVIYARNMISRYELDKDKIIPFTIIFLTAMIALTFFVFRKRDGKVQKSRKLIRSIPIVITMIAMFAFVLYLYIGFRSDYTELIEDNAVKTRAFVQGTVDDLLAKGLPKEELSGFEIYFETIADRTEGISSIELTEGTKINVVTSREYLKDKLVFLAATFGAIFIVCLMIMYELTGFIASLQEGGDEDTADAADNDHKPENGASEVRQGVKLKSVIRVLSFIVYTAIYVSMPYAAVIMRQGGMTVFGLSPSLSASLPLTVELIVILITTLLIQRLYADEKPLVLFFMAVMILIVGNAACLRVDSPYMLIVLRAFCGMGFAFLKYFFNSLVTSGSRDVGEIEQNFANMNAGLLGGITIGSSLGSILAGTFGYQSNYLFTAAVLAAAILPGWLLLRRRYSKGPDRTGRIDTASKRSVSVLSVLKNGKLRRAIILTDIPLNVGLMYVVAFLPVYMGVIGKPAIATGYAYLVNGLCGIYIGVFILGLLKKIPREKAVILSIIIGAAGILCLLLGTSVAVVIASAAIMGIFDGYGTPSMTGYFTGIAQEAADDSKGIITVYGSIGSAVQIICPVLYGILAQPDGNLIPITIFGLVFLMFGIIFGAEVRRGK